MRLQKAISFLLLLFLCSCASSSAIPASSQVFASATLPDKPTKVSTHSIATCVPTDSGKLSAFEHPLAPGYTFLVDTDFWDVRISNLSDQHYAIFSHKTIVNCNIDIYPTHTPPQPNQIYIKQVGRFQWQVREYRYATIYNTWDLYLSLVSWQNSECLAAQEKVLIELIYSNEATHESTVTPIYPGTRLPLPNFDCSSQPPKLRIGDNAYIIADLVFLRTKAELGDHTKYRYWNKHAPMLITVLDGPVCVNGDQVFWKVSVAEASDGAQRIPGWMAEAGPDEYYLENWNPGWSK